MLWVHKFSVRSVLLALGFAVLSPLIGAIAAEKLTAFYPFFPCQVYPILANLCKVDRQLRGDR